MSKVILAFALLVKKKFYTKPDSILYSFLMYCKGIGVNSTLFLSVIKKVYKARQLVYHGLESVVEHELAAVRCRIPSAEK